MNVRNYVLLGILLFLTALGISQISSIPAVTQAIVQYYQTVKDETVALTQRASINFTGTGVSCVDNAGTSTTDCTITSGSGSGAFQTVITNLTPTVSTVDNTSDTINIAAGICWGVSKSAATAKITAGTGSGSYVVYCAPSGAYVVLYSTGAGLTLTCSGVTCTDSPSPAVPEGYFPIASGSISANTPSRWGAPTNLIDFTTRFAFLNGTGMNASVSGSVVTLAVDDTLVQMKADDYVVTGELDASAATATKPNQTGTADPGTCSVGETFFRTDTGASKVCISSNTWTTLGGSSEVHDTTVFWEEEFDVGYPNAVGIYGRSKFNAGTASGSGAITLPPPNGEANHPGILQIATGATSGSFMSVGMWNQVLTGGGYDLDDTITMTWLFRMNNTSNVELRAGLSCGAANVSPPNDFVGLEKQFADTNFFLNARVSSTDSRVDSTVAVPSAGTWIAIQFARTSATQWGIRVATGSSALTSVGSATQTTFTPSSDPGCAATPFFQIENNTTADKQMDVDYVRLQISGMTR